MERQRGEVQDALAGWEAWMARGGGGGDGVVKRPEINVEQATRELDSLERKIKALEEKIRGQPGIAAGDGGVLA